MARWRKHKGENHPADAHGAVDVEFRDGDVSSYPDGESLGGWVHEGVETDVVAYRAKPSATPQPESEG